MHELLNNLTYEELLQLRTDIGNSAEYLHKLVTHKMNKIEATPRCTCANCQTPISDNSFTLIFGPHDFRKKATCCSLECQEMFLFKLRQSMVEHKH